MAAVRIIGGSAGGRRLATPRGAATRPTTDRVRESLFSILGGPPEGTRVLDLFAGSGALGLEALSRGADHTVFVDQAPAALEVLRANLRSLGFGDRATVLRADALRALPRLERAGERFGWIFVDPPYASGLADAVLERLGTGDLVAAEGVVAVEHDRRRSPAQRSGVLIRDDQRRYGDTVLSLYRRERP